MFVSASSVPSAVTVEILSEESGRELFDARVRALLGISGDEFLASYDAGCAWETYDETAVGELTMLIPFAR